jgi:predicted dehydrogenase
MMLKKRSTPLMLRYRVNVSSTATCEKQQESAIGRVIGDACHFLDLFCYLTESKPVAVSVEAIHTMRDDVFPTDNFTAQISFSDGSVCSLLYTALGHEHFGGEHLELFFDSKVIVMQDYVSLTGYGLPSWFDESASSADWGREHLVGDFFAGLRENPIRIAMSRERILTVSNLTLVIDTLACAGGGAKNISSFI